MKNKIFKFLKFIWPVAFFCFALFVLLNITYAQSYLGEGWDNFLGGLPTFTGAGDKTGEELAVSLIKNAIRVVKYIIGGVALIMGTLYGFNLILARGKEQEIEQQKSNFLYVFVGFIVLIISENLASIFNPVESTTDKIIDFDAARDQLRDAVDYIKWFFGSVIVLLMVVSSLKMIMSAGEEEEITTQKRNITWSIIAMLIILLASNIVNAIYVISSPGEVVAGETETLLVEVAAVIRLGLVFMGPLAIFFTLYAGFTYLTAMEDETAAQTGKRMLIGGLTGIVIIYSAYALVNTFVSSRIALAPFLTQFT